MGPKISSKLKKSDAPATYLLSFFRLLNVLFPSWKDTDKKRQKKYATAGMTAAIITKNKGQLLMRQRRTRPLPSPAAL